MHVDAWRAGYAGQLPAAYLAALSVEERTLQWAALIGAPDRHLLAVTAPEVIGFASFGPGLDDPTAGELYAFYLGSP